MSNGWGNTLADIFNEIINDPKYIEQLTAGQLLLFLHKINSVLIENREFPLINFKEDSKKETVLIFIGDTHGDLIITRWIIKNIFEKEHSFNNIIKLIFLGDYVDRVPKDIPYGGVKNLLYLLALKLKFPNNIFLLRGNHEGYGLFDFAPYDLPNEILGLWKEIHQVFIHKVLLKVFSNLPIFVKTSNGIFASHGGFPKLKNIENISKDDRDEILDTLWGDPSKFAPFRGPISTMTNFTKNDLIDFLEKIDCKIMIRGHSFDKMGYSLFDNKLLTIFTSRGINNRGAGGVLLIRSPLSKNIQSVQDLEMYEIVENKLKKREIFRYD
jgi:hypothetical protein